MGIKRVTLIAGAVVALVGLVLLRDRMASTEESFYRSEIWLPHQVMGGSKLALSWQGPIAGEKVSLGEARARTLFPILLPSYMPEGAALREVYVSGMDKPRLYREAALVYENGVYIILRYGGTAWSWESPFRERPEGFEPVEVSDHGGVGADPRPETYCVSYAPSEEWECSDGPGLVPGVVEWQADGLVTAIYSYDYPLAELLRVAESMDVQ